MVAAIGAVAAVGSAAISSSAAGSAASSQAQSAEQATYAQMMAQAQLRQDLSPWVESGRGANSLLNQYMGIGGAGSNAVTSLGLGTGLTPTQVREQLMGRFTRNAPAPGAGVFNADNLPINERIHYERIKDDPAQRAAFEATRLGSPGYMRGNGSANDGVHADEQVWGQSPQNISTVDEEGLNAAIQQYYAEQEALNAQAAQDPRYGSLLRAYRNGAEFDSGPAFSFTGKDLASEPGYQFGLNQGTQGIERGQAARGNFLSGAAMKELTRFNEDYAGTKYNEGFNRSLTSYNTNLNRRQNEWNTNLGAYNQNRNTIYDFLTGVSRTGQNSAAQVGTANNRAAESAGNNMMAAGNAQAAGTVAGANALSSGINQAANAYNSTNNLNSAAGWNTLLSGQGGGYSGYTGYVGQSDPITNLNTQNGWTS